MWHLSLRAPALCVTLTLASAASAASAPLRGQAAIPDTSRGTRAPRLARRVQQRRLGARGGLPPHVPEQETHRNVELMWLLRGLRPDFKTIADFRRDHPQALKGVCPEFILLCKRLNLFGGELLAIDGSKFRAVNARDRSYTAPRLKELIRKVDRTIARYLRQLERQDEREAGTEGPTAETLREQIAALEQRRARYETLQQDLAASGGTAISLTDLDSRPMKSGAGIEICYNVQTAVDAKHKLIAAEEVTNAAGDRDQPSRAASFHTALPLVSPAVQFSHASLTMQFTGCPVVRLR